MSYHYWKRFNAKWRDIPEKAVSKITIFLQDDITALLQPHDCESFQWHHTYFIPTLSCDYPKLMSEHLERDTSTFPEHFVIGHNSLDIPEGSAGRITKSTPLFLIFWVIPEQRRGFGRNVAVRLWLLAALLLTVSCWQGLKRQSSDWGWGQERAGKTCSALRQLAHSLASLSQNVDVFPLPPPMHTQLDVPHPYYSYMCVISGVWSVWFHLIHVGRRWNHIQSLGFLYVLSEMKDKQPSKRTCCFSSDVSPLTVYFWHFLSLLIP